MNKRLLEIYALSMCFVSMACLSIFFGIFLYSIVEISFPPALLSSKMYYPPSSFNQGGVIINTNPSNFGDPFQVAPREKVEENSFERNKRLQKEQEQFQLFETKRVKAETIMSIIRSIIVVFIASIVFIFHWRIAKQARIDKSI